MSTVRPRVVTVTRPTPYRQLLVEHGTRGQAAFYLGSRGQSIDVYEQADERLSAALGRVTAAVPAHWRHTHLDRGDLDRFVFEPSDVLVPVGQDGLVANVAKYLDGQIVIGVNPLPELYDGVLVQHNASDFGELLGACEQGEASVAMRTMVEAELDDGQSIVALNELYVGHCSHQSSRYLLRYDGGEERQSSSGLIVATGTGATGWARSIALSRGSGLALPAPEDPTLVYFSREAFPSKTTGTSLCEGLVDAARPLEIVSELESGGVLFGDGIEADCLHLRHGQTLRLKPAERRLHLVRPLSARGRRRLDLKAA